MYDQCFDVFILCCSSRHNVNTHSHHTLNRYVSFTANVQLRKVPAKEVKELKEDDEITIPEKESPLGKLSKQQKRNLVGKMQFQKNMLNLYTQSALLD